ncbi:MAG: glutamate dehydrogenase [Verrucomicrobia bacterium RIFCSPHIGHO2_12_FULL_41_10]|nr:MAG: glutamate dehydrogenase [Verrucomicrobia bacterium RIFCSPHIGHO2_12_FULL_41_10]
MSEPKYPPLSGEELQVAIAKESERFKATYLWLEKHLPSSFLNEVDPETRIVIARNLLSFSLQGKWIQIRLKAFAVVCCIDGPAADLQILKPFGKFAIRYYRTFVSNEPLPGEAGNLRIGILYFRESEEEKLDAKTKESLFQLVKEEHPQLESQEFATLIQGLSPRFIHSMNVDGLRSSIRLFFQAKLRDQCQYELKRNEDWKSKEVPSLQLIIAWRSVPKGSFLYRLVQVIHSHRLALQTGVATYVDPYSCNNVVLLSLGLHGLSGKAAWEETDIDDFMRELALTKYFDLDDPVGTTFVQPTLLTGNEGHLVRNFISFTHQILVHADPNLYSLDKVVEGFCRHPELTVKLCKAFSWKFNPKQNDLKIYEKEKNELFELIEKLDTGQALNDLRRKNILKQGLYFVDSTLKTNFYRTNKTSFSFRIDPTFLEKVPYAREEKFPEIPFAIFFIRGMHFIGFNVRFRDLARGGVRTIIPAKREQFNSDRNNLFFEAYQLAYTQQKKNKDIPEGGAKTAILLKPTDVFQVEEEIFVKEMKEEGLANDALQTRLAAYQKEKREAYINASQRCLIDSLLTLINCKIDGTLRTSSVIDYWNKPEYIYLGPDENISNEMLVWIADYAVEQGYAPGRAFMSSSPKGGINHKHYGVTSYGLHVYLEEVLHFLNIDPYKTPFTIKISGGPDGDVAGNEILNLSKFYPKTAKVIALTDVSGTIFDPQGLNLETLTHLFHEVKSIRHYPAEILSDGGFLLDLQTKKEETAYAISTLLLKKKEGKVIQEWLSGNEMNLLYRNNLHQTVADIFIPAGGRPRTLNENNVESFLKGGKPTSKAIVEGANLYLTPGARRVLEKLGVLIFKDSSCNKGGVITSSLEVLANLCMSEEEFLKIKEDYIKEVLTFIHAAAKKEARLLLETHRKTGAFLTDLSEETSEKINTFKYQILDHLKNQNLPHDPNDLLIQCLIHYAPPILQNRFLNTLLKIPDLHQKAIIGCYIASRLVYGKGLSWTPNIIDLLPTLKMSDLDS